MTEHKILKYENGKYSVDIDISTSEWKSMLLNKKLFTPSSMDMIWKWYLEESHQATSKDIIMKYNSNLRGTPYNGIVKGLSQRILNHLGNRFWVEDSSQSGKNSYWCLPFEGWHLDYDTSKNFVWKLRDELVNALNELCVNGDLIIPDDLIELNDPLKINNDPLTSSVAVKEGKSKQIYTTKYERNSRSRNEAIRINRNKNKGRLRCDACGFDFEVVYGERGANLIEVHHNQPLYLYGEQEVNFEKDLDCLCSNCHRIIHCRRSEIITVDELKKIIFVQKIKNSTSKQ